MGEGVPQSTLGFVIRGRVVGHRAGTNIHYNGRQVETDGEGNRKKREGERKAEHSWAQAKP